LKRVGDSRKVRAMLFCTRSTSDNIRLACSLSAKTGETLRWLSLQTTGNHSDGWIISGPLTIAVKKPSSISRSMQSCGTPFDARKASSSS
jgi:hypothetical protein